MAAEHVDVVIVGAGLSGIGAACHLQRSCRGTSFTILEARESLGGTWDQFRYPGVRSDSDMFTLGYSFRPWTGERSMADGPSILQYVRDTAREHDVERHIRFGHRVEGAEWSSATKHWEVTARHTGSDEVTTLTCSFLLVCTGYYRYDEGYTPDFPGVEEFGGQLVHPQHWPADLDHAGKRVVVIGSGATAVTLVPAMAESAEHVTMLQRSPSYVLALPGRDVIADRLRRYLPAKVAYAVVRWKNVVAMTAAFQVSRRRPDFMKSVLRKRAAAHLPSGYDVDTDFGPTYQPWDQRMCFIPDGDLFAALSSGRASIVTDTIDAFVAGGIRLSSGDVLDADIVVSATGLNLLALGGMRLVVDGADVDLATSMAYKGMMLSGVPNFAFVIGYTNASWTLRADIVNQRVCRLLNHMAARGYATATPEQPDTPQVLHPVLDLQAGYVRRGADQIPLQGESDPWRAHQNYPRELVTLRHGRLDDDAMVFGR